MASMRPLAQAVQFVTGTAVGVQACQLAPLNQSAQGAVWLSEGGQSRRLTEMAQGLDQKLW